MKNINLMLFFVSMMLSIIIGSSSKSILYFWFMMEINLMSFIPLMIFSNKKFNDCFMKYFLIQSIASSLMLLFFSMIYFDKINKLIMLFILSMILLKMGLAPFHYWYLNILNNLSWWNCAMLMTIQKILIFYMYDNFIFPYKMMNSSPNLNLMFMLLLMNMTWSIISIYNTNSIKIIMGASSINNMSWLILLLSMNFTLWFYYFLIYSYILIFMIIIFNNNNCDKLKTLIKMNFTVKFILLTLMLLMLMLPPMLSFFIKIFTMKIFMTKNMITLSYFILLISMIYSYFYMKMLFPSIFLITKFNLNMKIMQNINLNFIYLMILLNSFTLIYFIIA